MSRNFCETADTAKALAARLAAAEQALLARDKTIRVLVQRVQDQQDRKGSVLALLSQNTELQQVVARKTAELEQRANDLDKSLSVLNAMLESTADGVMVVDDRGRIVNHNSKCPVLGGLSQELISSCENERILKEIMAQLRRPEEFLAKAREIEAQPEAESHDHIEFKDGRLFERHSHPLRLGSRCLGRVWSFRNITEQRRAEISLQQSELKFRVLVEHSLVGVYILQDGHFVYANPRMTEFFGYTTDEIISSCVILDLICEEDRALVQEQIRRRIAGEVAGVHYTFHGLRKDGSRITVEALGAKTQFDGKPAIIGTLLDVTERERNQRMALRSQRLEAIGTLASGVAHDLNNALAPIMMGVELLRSQYPGESAIVEMFHTSARRGADMVRQLLNFAKGAEGERVPLQLGHLVKGIHRMMRGSFPKNIQLEIQCDPQLPTVLGDATQLDQVLLNLCVNARDAMPHGGKLTLEARQVAVDAAYAASIPDAKPGNYAMVRVRDTGTGIPPEILDRIFEPFFTTKAADRGTGLGLSTVIGIVKGHGGFLQVYSQLGKGSTFSVYLPINLAGKEARSTNAAKGQFRGHGEVVLFVDDEPTVRGIARAVLRRLNFEPLTARDGADGLIQAAQYSAALRVVITDLHMPNLDGLGFLRALRQTLPCIPVMVASGRLEEAVAVEFKNLGVTIRLDKPFTEHQMAMALQQALGSK